VVGDEDDPQLFRRRDEDELLLRREVVKSPDSPKGGGPNTTNKISPWGLMFWGSFVPDIWAEKQWFARQAAPANVLGVSKIVIISERPPGGSRKVNVIGVQLLDLEDVMIRLTDGKGEERGGKEPGIKLGDHGKLPSPKNANRRQALYVSWTKRRDLTTADVVKAILGSSHILEGILDYMNKRSDKDGGRNVTALVTDAPTVSGTAHIVASALATVQALKTADQPTSLFQSILKVKAAYPYAVYTPDTISYLASYASTHPRK
jgi:hypothetical protein